MTLESRRLTPYDFQETLDRVRARQCVHPLQFAV
jgi:hypothetical protein